MVSFKCLLLGAAAVVGVTALTPAEIQTALQGASAAAGSSGSKRDLVHTPRNTVVDPYSGFHCYAPYTLPPCATTCNRNNCFRAFLNARSGSSGKHCPIQAFAVCCVWNWFDDSDKAYAVSSGLLTAIVPWTANCQDSSDTPASVVAKVNDVCGCTLDHEVTLDITANPDYYNLKPLGFFDPNCNN